MPPLALDSFELAVRLYWALGVIVTIALSLAVSFALYMAIRAVLFHRARVRAERGVHRPHGPDPGPPSIRAGGWWAGAPGLPPRAPGLCQSCGRVFDELYHLPSGRRLCDNCLPASNPDQLMVAQATSNPDQLMAGLGAEKPVAGEGADHG